EAQCPPGGGRPLCVQGRKSCFTDLTGIPAFLAVACLEQFAHAGTVACNSPGPPPRDLPARKTTREWDWWRSRGATWRRAVAAVSERRVAQGRALYTQRSPAELYRGARSSERERYARQVSRLGAQRPSTSPSHAS